MLENSLWVRIRVHRSLLEAKVFEFKLIAVFLLLPKSDRTLSYQKCDRYKSW
ncbi:hypothetical protein [Anabaena sp. WFMT]|uniref:hypothetical protein n=1 Tax=Anabaena sp. WFMT TaxID=3449730 RepID=UPI003F6A15D5